MVFFLVPLVHVAINLHCVVVNNNKLIVHSTKWKTNTENSTPFKNCLLFLQKTGRLMDTDGIRIEGSFFLALDAPVVEKIYYFFLVEGDSAPVKSKKFRKIANHLHNDPRGTQETLVQYLGKNATCMHARYIQRCTVLTTNNKEGTMCIHKHFVNYDYIILSFHFQELYISERGTLLPHGNNTAGRAHIRTAPSEIKEAGKARCDPSLRCYEKIAGGEVPTTHESTLKPRNPRQVRMHNSLHGKSRDTHRTTCSIL